MAGTSAKFIGPTFGGTGGKANQNKEATQPGTLFTAKGTSMTQASNGSNHGTKAHFIGGTATQTGGKAQMGAKDPLAKHKGLNE